MNGYSQTITQVIGGKERSMIPPDSQPSTSKRKASGEDGTLHNNVAKKVRKEVGKMLFVSYLDLMPNQ